MEILNVLSDDVSINVSRPATSFTDTATAVMMGMWGSAMFGSPTILGYWLYYQSGTKNVLSADVSLNTRNA